MSIDMRIVSVPADGDCLYHAFIKGLSIPGLTPQQLRDFVADKILHDKDLYDDLVREWIDFNVIPDVQRITPQMAADRIRKTKEWATSTVIHILAVAFNVRIVVFQRINEQFYSEIFPSEWKRDITSKRRPYKDVYLFRRGYHFELLTPIDKLGYGAEGNGNENGNVGLKRTGGIGTQRGGGVDPSNHVACDPSLTVTLGLLGIICFICTL